MHQTRCTSAYILDPWCKDKDKNGRMLTTLELLERAVYIENDTYIKALLEKCTRIDKDLKKVPQIRHIMKMSGFNFIETVSCLEISVRIWLLQGTLPLPVEIFYLITSYVLGTNVDAIKFQLKFNTTMHNIFLKRFLNARFGGPDKWTQLKDESRDETIYTLADHSVVSKKSRHEHPHEHLTHYSNKLGLNLFAQVVSKSDTRSDEDVKFHKKLI